jgi:ADP-heptose:LPS heptosyltransferase
MDAADLIVSIDTSFLHLSAATKTPVIALSTDTPSTWHGSAWHPRFAMHCRYGDYLLRKSELLHVARKAIKDLTRGGEKVVSVQ